MAILLPSFVFVAIVYPLVPPLRSWPITSAFLDGGNVAAVGLMAAVTSQLARSAFVDGLTVAMALIAAALLLRLRLNSAMLIAIGAS